MTNLPHAEPEGLEVNPAILRQLQPRQLVGAYAHGAFPMVQDGRLYWFSPDPRGLMPLDERFHITRRLARTIRSGRFVCTVNRCFDRVMHLCSRCEQSDAVWISPEIRISYNDLHRMGFAHSVEVWPAGAVGEGEPAGGLYGVALGAAFFAESMFHTVTDAGKVGLVHLVDRLRRGGYQLCDIQWTSDNLRRFGAVDLPRDRYLHILMSALARPVGRIWEEG